MNALLILAFVASTARDIGSTLSAMRDIAIPDDPTHVPPVARLFVANAKDQLRDFTSSLLRDQPGDAKLVAAHLQGVLHAELAAVGAFEECESELGSYGSLYEPEVTAPQPNLIAVKVALRVPCGSDEALFLFRYEEGSWQLVFDRERTVNESIGDATGSVMFNISPPDARGSLLILTADINPWCSSMWQTLRWQVDRINRGWREPESITHDEEATYLDENVKLDVTPDTFTLRFTGRSIDGARGARPFIRSYRIDVGDRLTRLEPIAETPLDFVEEWLLMTRPKGDERLFGEFEKPGRCRDGMWQIAFDPFDEDGNDQDPMFFFVADENGSFRMVATAGEPREGCDRI